MTVTEYNNLFLHLTEHISHNHSAFSVSVSNTYTDASTGSDKFVSNVTLCVSTTLYNQLHNIIVMFICTKDSY